MNPEVNTEISVAVNFMLSHLYNKLPRRRVDAFADEVERGILSKFQGHWYPEKPSKGAAYRCIGVSSEKIDPVILNAARHSGLEVDEVRSCLPEELMLWIDPGEVSYTVGDRGGVKVLYSEHAIAMQSRSPPGCLQAQHLMIEQAMTQVQSSLHSSMSPEPYCDGGGLSSSLESLSLSPLPGSSSPWPSLIPGSDTWGHQLGLPLPGAPSAFRLPPPHQPIAQPQPNAAAYGPQTRGGGTSGGNKTFTAAMFAQTKFGSTKLKSKAKNPSRLSPTVDPAQAFSLPSVPTPPSTYLPSQQSLAAPSMSAASSPPMLLPSRRAPTALHYDHFQDMSAFHHGIAQPMGPIAGSRDAAAGVDEPLLSHSPAALSAHDSGRTHAWLDLRGLAYPAGPFRHVMVA